MDVGVVIREGVKAQFIGFCCSGQLKGDFSKAIAERGEFNTYTAFFLKAMSDYVKETQEMRNHAR